MKLFIYCLREFDEKEFFDELKADYDYSYAGTPAYPSLKNAHLAAGYDGVSITPGTCDEALLTAFHALGVRYILTRSIGYEHIDLACAKRLAMGVSHVAYPPDTVANYAITLILMTLRNMRQIIDRSAIQDYTLKGKMGRDIEECTIGVIGAGQIGQTVIEHLHGFGCKILAYDLYPSAALQNKCDYVTLPELYRRSDVITLHAPATDENYHLLDAQAFSQMKPGVSIVNTARGTLVDTEALINALEQGLVSGAALDVLEDENGLYYANRVGDCIANRHMAILRSFPNVILTPHTAFYTRKVVKYMALHTVRCMFDMQEGRANPLVIT